MSSTKFIKAFEQSYLSKGRMDLQDQAVITTARVTGTLLFNAKAMNIMGLKPNSKVHFIYLDDKNLPLEQRIFVTAGFNFDGKIYGNKIQEYGKFNNSEIYNAMISQGQFSFQNNLLMVEKGYFIQRAKEDYVARFKVAMDVEPYEEIDSNGQVIRDFIPAEGVAAQAFFRFKNWRIIKEY